jgi:hypothetical protein
MTISPDVCHQLPQDRCCNCDSRTELELLPVEYSLQPGSVAGDAYLGMVLRLPFCARCRPTAKRRKLRAAEAFVMGFLLFFFIILTLGWAFAGSNYRDPVLFMAIAGVVGFGLPFGIPLCLRPLERQSSFWRPVEIKAIIDKKTPKFTTLSFQLQILRGCIRSNECSGNQARRVGRSATELISPRPVVQF